MGNEQGIWLDGAAVGLQVGDGTPAGANVVSGNTAVGVLLNKTAGAVVAGNTIGRTADGSETRPNGPRGGIQLLDNAGGVVGGDAPGAANVIDGGPNASVRVEGDNQLGTRLFGNVLRGTSGGGLAIDLYPVGVTANDAGDADTGPNGLQNAPVVTVANPTSVTGTIGTKASTPARIQLFAASADGREALALLGDTTVTTDGAGAATFSVPVSATVGGSVVATATTGDGTSELSAPVTVTAPVAVPVFGLKGAKFGLSATKRKLKVRILNDTGADLRVQVRAKGTKKPVTKTVAAHRSGRFALTLRASTRRKLVATLRRKDKATYRPAVTITNRTSGIERRTSRRSR